MNKFNLIHRMASRFVAKYDANMRYYTAYERDLTVSLVYDRYISEDFSKDAKWNGRLLNGYVYYTRQIRGVHITVICN